MNAGSQRTLAFWSCASAIQALAWAMATMMGRASASRRAVARLIGKERSPASNGGAFRSTTCPPGGGGNSRGDFCDGRGEGRVGSASRAGGAGAVAVGEWSTQSCCGLARGLGGDVGIWARQDVGSNRQSSATAKASITLPNRSIPGPHPPHADRNASCGTPIGSIVESNRLIAAWRIMTIVAIFRFLLIFLSKQRL